VTRRDFLATPAALAVPATPWYRRTLRWGQTNITEADPPRYDIAWWRAYWKRTRIQGVIVNAGGIVAYYPSKFPLHHRAEFLGGRDLYGELAQAAHQDGLVVLARMDSNRAAEDFYRAHPDWFARNAAGEPYRAADKYVACVNSPYYDEYLPAVLEEIIGRSRPEGVTDNSWSGLARDSVCYCDSCARKFGSLPRRADWDDPDYRRWIQWSYARRLEIWDLNNRVTKAAGGPDCLWIGMNSGSIASQSRSFRDYREICRRAEIVMLDHQARSDAAGFAQNAETGKLIHGLLGWDKLIPESTALYQAGRTSFRMAARPEPEVRLWFVEGFAGGIQPWWHHVGGRQEDQRQFRTAEPIYRWHEANEQYLANRRPVAAVGVVWSQRNTDYYGRDDAAELVELPWRGFTQALVRARIPWLPTHADDIDRDGAELAALVLPDLAAMSDAQCAAVRRFVARGGALIATGASSLYTEWGDRRPDFALADLFGAHGAPEKPAGSVQSYLRLGRHLALEGFEDTDILAYGGVLGSLRIDPGAETPLTYIPPFPAFPPETAWMRQARTDMPALVIKGRVSYLAADLDRRFAKDNLPDHARLLANLVRWAVAGNLPFEIEGRGLFDCHLYRQPGRLILHVVNLTNPAAWRSPADELIPAGPLRVRVRGAAGRARLLVSGAGQPVREGVFEIPRIVDHEVAVLSS
jgi:hypothetical protein